jgi:cytochrome c556
MTTTRSGKQTYDVEITKREYNKTSSYWNKFNKNSEMGEETTETIQAMKKIIEEQNIVLENYKKLLAVYQEMERLIKLAESKINIDGDGI